MFRSQVEDHGSDLAAELDEILDEHHARVQDRHAVVQHRLADLEAESHTLGRLARRHEAVRNTN